jgi:hypothetical protein
VSRLKCPPVAFVPACDSFSNDPATPWPVSLRVKPVRSAAGVMEMTWSFASPDGRATFEFVTVGGELGVRCAASEITTSSGRPLVRG